MLCMVAVAIISVVYFVATVHVTAFIVAWNLAKVSFRVAIDIYWQRPPLDNRVLSETLRRNDI